MLFQKQSLSIVLLLFVSVGVLAEKADIHNTFKENKTWQFRESNPDSEKRYLILSFDKSNLPETETEKEGDLITQTYFSDIWLSFEVQLTEHATSQVYLQGRYAIQLSNGAEKGGLTYQNMGGLDARLQDGKLIDGVAPLTSSALSAGEWQRVEIKFRAPRFDDARNKTDEAMLIEVKVNDSVVQQNVLIKGFTQSSRYMWEDQFGPVIITGSNKSIMLRKINIRHADFGSVKLPSQSGEITNINELIDFVSLGNETFHGLGCGSCHAVKSDDPSVKSGPNLYGLMKRTPRNREVVEGDGNHRFTVKADRSYLVKSIREPALQRAVAETGTAAGEAYLPIMPPYSAQTISDKQIDAIGAYLATLNPLPDQGPAIHLVTQDGPQQYDPLKDDLQLLVDKRLRIQRGPMEGVSARSIHVGQANGINYSFDPRLLSIVKVWQGGFLDVAGELKNRGGRGLKTGFESRALELGSAGFLLAPLNEKGQQIDFSFKEAIFNDTKAITESLYSKQDHLARLSAVDAQFLGYEQDSKKPQSAPLFRYRIGKNHMSYQMQIAANGDTEIRIHGAFATPQVLAVNTEVLHEPVVSGGSFKLDTSKALAHWTIPANTETELVLRSKLLVASTSWRPAPSTFNHDKQKVQVIPAKAELPVGYRVESYLPPRDNYGREQLFEALGLAVAEDGTIVVATRTAGIWRIVKGEWQLFAEGIFDSLGVVIEDKKGLQLVVGQKAELTRIVDTNNDGRADKYETLFDAHSFHGNYHAYMHGPARGADDAYYIALNLSHSDEAIYKANGMYMGSSGGLSGWAVRVTPQGEYTLWANGLRSPAGIATAPDGRLWYSDNQGEFVATSKIFVLKKDGFYGHPSGLVDLPGMTPDSPEIAWEKVSESREPAVILLPQNRVANSPGHPVWDTTKGRFGPFAGQMYIGDQTQSNLLRVVTESVNGIEQGVVIPFAAGLESGVMRPIFLADGSLLLGQTGRGWQAKGGHVASLQRIVRDDKAVPASIYTVSAKPGGFELTFTQATSVVTDESFLKDELKIISWVYRDAPDYGSEIMDERQEAIVGTRWSEDKKSLFIQLATTDQPRIHPQQTARVYHIAMNGSSLFGQKGIHPLEAYYTLYHFPVE